jgi:single-strand DNA-binding protein
VNNRVFLMGNLSQPPYFDRVGEKQRPFLRLYLAVDRPGRRGTDYVRVVGYDRVALLFPHFETGSGLAVAGRFRTRKIRKRDGVRDTICEVVASTVAFLRRIEWQEGDRWRAEVAGVIGDEGQLEPVWERTRGNNDVLLLGNLSQAPHFDRLPESGDPFLRYYLAVDRPGGGADYARVVAYGNLAELSFPYLRRGSEVVSSGRLRVRKFTGGDGRRRTAVEVVADDVTFLRNVAWEEGDRVREQILAEREEAGA